MNEIIRRQRHLGVEEVLAAIDHCKGNRTKTAEYLHVRWTILWTYVRRHTRLLQAFKEWEHKNVDAMEANLIDIAVVERDRWAMATYLAAKARERGYGQHNGVGSAGGNDATLRVTSIIIKAMESGKYCTDEDQGVVITTNDEPTDAEELIIDENTGDPVIIEGTIAEPPQPDAMEQLRKQLGP